MNEKEIRGDAADVPEDQTKARVERLGGGRAVFAELGLHPALKVVLADERDREKCGGLPPVGFPQGRGCDVDDDLGDHRVDSRRPESAEFLWGVRRRLASVLSGHLQVAFEILEPEGEGRDRDAPGEQVGDQSSDSFIRIHQSLIGSRRLC